MAKFKVGIAGFDHVHVTRYLPMLKNHPDVEITAIAARGANSKLAKKESQKCNAQFYTNYQDFFEKSSLDAAYVATDPVTHLEIVKMAARAGVHLLLDKPIATNMEDAQEIIKISGESQIRIMVPFNPRFQYPVLKAREKIESGQLGDLVHIYSVKVGKNPLIIPNFDSSWFADPQRAGFGGFADIGIHAVDGIRWLVNSPVRSVFARISSKFWNLKVDDFGVMTMDFENGTTAVLVSGWANPENYPKWLDVRFEILGTRSAVKIEKPYHDYRVYGESGLKLKDWLREDIDRIVDEFILSLREKRKPILDAENATENLRVILAAYESSQIGKRINI